MSKLTERQLKEEFHKFLRENDCASKFYAAIYNPKNKSWGKFHEYGISKYVIVYVFGWDNTPEKRSYWSELHCKWEERYKEITA